MLKKHCKKALALLFLGIVLSSGLLVNQNISKGLCNINFPYQICVNHITF